MSFDGLRTLSLSKRLDVGCSVFPPSFPPAFLPDMRWFIITAILLLVAGAGCVLYAQSFPIYSHADAPSRISNEIGSHPKETRTEEWYARLHAVETPHKRLSDLGRGLCAAGVGLLAAAGLWRGYLRWPEMRSAGVLLALWFALWLVRIPFTFWYYGLRQQRFDYPIWGDSIAIPVVSESIAWVVGAVVTSIMLRLLLVGHSLPVTIRFTRPASAFGWLRAVVIGGWLALLGVCIFSGVSDGDEGLALTSTIAAVILLLFLSASKLTRPDEPSTPDAELATDGA